MGSKESLEEVQMRDEGGFTKRVSGKMEKDGQIQMLEIVPGHSYLERMMGQRIHKE